MTWWVVWYLVTGAVVAWLIRLHDHGPVPGCVLVLWVIFWPVMLVVFLLDLVSGWKL